MLSIMHQKLVLELDAFTLGKYKDTIETYGNKRSLYNAVKYLEKQGLIEKYDVPVINKCRVMLTARGKVLAMVLVQPFKL